MGGDRQAPGRRWQPTALSRLIARRLHELDLKQADLARRLHVHQSYVSQLVAGRLPDMDAPGFIETYAQALEMDPDTFMVEAELWRYNLVPPAPGDLTPGHRAVLAAVGPLSEDARHQVARGLREMFADRWTVPQDTPAVTFEEGPPDGVIPPSSEEDEIAAVKAYFRRLPEDEARAALALFEDLIARRDGAVPGEQTPAKLLRP